MAGDELLTVQEVATRLKLNPETVRRWLRSGRLSGTRFGGSGGYRVSVSEVQKLLAGSGPTLPPEPREPQGGEMTGTERGREG